MRQRYLNTLAILAVLVSPLSQADGVKPRAAVFGVAINVSDIERSGKYYENIFGLKEVMRVTGHDGKPHELVLSASGKLVDGQAIVLAKADAATVGQQAFGRVIFTVTDAHALADRAKSAGFEITQVSEPKPPGVAAVVIFLKDPDGYAVELFQPAAMAAPQSRSRAD